MGEAEQSVGDGHAVAGRGHSWSERSNEEDRLSVAGEEDRPGVKKRDVFDCGIYRGGGMRREPGWMVYRLKKPMRNRKMWGSKLISRNIRRTHFPHDPSTPPL